MSSVQREVELSNPSWQYAPGIVRGTFDKHASCRSISAGVGDDQRRRTRTFALEKE